MSSGQSGQSVLGTDDVKGLITPQMVDSQTLGLEYLGGWEAAGIAAGVAASATVIVPPRDLIVIMGRCLWTGTTVDRLALQVGVDDVDTTARYWNRTVISRGTDTGTLGQSDGGVFQGNAVTPATNWALQFTGGLDAGTIKHRSFFVQISNISGLTKLGTWFMTRNSDLVGTSGGIMSGQGEYISTDIAQPSLTAFRFITIAGSASIGPESGIGIFGRDFGT